MAARLAVPLSNGMSHAPAISTRPGCTHSGLIVVVRAHQPEFPQQLRHQDDRDAGEEAVDGTKRRPVLEGKVSGLVIEKRRDNRLCKSQHHQPRIERACELHGFTIAANFRTGSGYIPRSRLSTALKTVGITINGAS